jgi:TonB family protein
VPVWRAWFEATPVVRGAALAAPGVVRSSSVAAPVGETTWAHAARVTLGVWGDAAARGTAEAQEMLRSIDAAGLGVVLLVGWLALTLLLSVRLVRGAWTLHTLTARARVTRVDGEAVLLTDGFGPATVGWRTPRIVLPAWVRDLDAPLRSLVLAHEREHRDARDPRLVWLATLAVALVPWNPSVWWLARRLRLAIERDCDARTIAAVSPTPAPQAYARLLLFMAQQVGRMSSASSFSSAPLASAMASSRSHLHARIRTMHASPIDPTSRPARRQRAVFGGVTLLAVAAACSTDIPGSVTPPGASDSRSASPIEVVAVPEVGSIPMPNGMLDTVPPGVPDTVTAKPYFEFQVERPAAMRGAISLQYPPLLRSAQVEGRVLASFVVDANGRVDLSTFGELRSDHPSFTDAVRQALASAQYQAAEVGGRKVSQVVQQPFIFALDRSAQVLRSAESGTAVVVSRAWEGVTAPWRRDPADINRAPAGAYFEFQVDEPARMQSGANLRYAIALREAGIEGTVLAQFVLDTDGRIDPSSFKVLKADHEGFVESVREALPRMRYTAARKDGRAVRQVVQQPFVFNIAR